KNIESVFNEILKDEMVIDELIYCAGINYLSDAISITEDIWDKVMAVNLKGCFFVMKEVAKNMILNDNKGCMVSIGSQHGMVGNFDRAAYCSSKAGLINLNKVLAL